jgi:hypothetical protein
MEATLGSAISFIRKDLCHNFNIYNEICATILTFTRRQLIKKIGNFTDFEKHIMV